MLILANPNNPTGSVIPLETLSAIADVCLRRQIRFVADESFIDFTSQPSLARRASRQRCLMVLRSFTKFYAFPGLRIGYLVAHPGLVEEFSRRQEPWSVNTLALIAAAESIADSSFREKSLALIARERRYLSGGLTKLGWLDPYPSEANFLLVRIQHPVVRAIDLRKELEVMRILIRDCTDLRGLGQKYFRVAIRTRKENRSLLEALRRVGNAHANQRRT
jgi:threonine-phosphate decarboxylase